MFYYPNNKYPHHIPSHTYYKQFPSVRVPPTKTGPHADTNKPGNQGGIRMFEQKEPHVYELTLPEHFEHIDVHLIGERTLRIKVQ